MNHNHTHEAGASVLASSMTGGNMKDPEAAASREAIDAVVAASVAGTASQAAVNWVFARAAEQFWREASSRAGSISKQRREER